MKILKIEARNSGSGCLPAKTSCSPFSLFQSLSARQAKWHQSKEQWFSLITLLAGLLVFIAPAHGSEPSVLTKPSSQTKLVLSAEDLKFGAEQLERLLHDRPELNKMIIKGDSIWNWAVGQFAGVATGERIFWDESDLYSKSFECFGDNLYATPGKPGRIRLRKTDSDGKPMAADKLAYGLIYECSNIGSGPDYKRVDQSALRGELTKEQYIEDELRIEFRAYSKTKDVYQKILLPLTKIRLYPLDPSIWDFSGPKTCDSWVAQLLDQPGYPRDYYGDYYQYTLQPKSNFRRARDLTFLSSSVDTTAPNNWNQYNHDGIESFKKANYNEADKLFRASLDAVDGVPTGTKYAAISLNNLALTNNREGKCDEAERLYQRALQINEKALVPSTVEFANCLNNFAVFYDDQERYAEAEPLYRRALEIREKTLDPYDPLLANSFGSLAWLYEREGKYADATGPMKRALTIEEKRRGPNDPQVATCLEHLAQLLMKTNRAEEAGRLAARAKEIRAHN